MEELVRRNAAAAVEEARRTTDSGDAVDRAVNVLAMITAQPADMAELEPWAVSEQLIARWARAAKMRLESLD